jgi:hypothetical protein
VRGSEPVWPEEPTGTGAERTADASIASGAGADGALGVTAASGAAGPPRRRRRWLRWLVGIVAVLLVVAVGLLLWWVLRYPDAEPAAAAAAYADPRVEVSYEDGTLVLEPVDGHGDTGLVFYPGAAVPQEAYLATWVPIVAETGVSVFVPAMPLRLAILASDRADTVIRIFPELTTWWVGGHSLGGAMAASFAGGSDPGELAGLVLFGAYATEGAGLAERDDLVVLSVAGSEDGLSTPADIDERAAFLPPPPATTFVELDGVNHAQFGAYGEQAGDGTPRVSDEEARRLIAEAVVPVLTP